MEDKEVVKQLRYAADQCDRTNFGCRWPLVLHTGADLIEELQARITDKQYLVQGIMYSVDKWLNAEERKQPEVHRATVAREKALKAIEALEAQLTASQARERATVECLEEVEYSLANSRFSAAWAAIRKWRGPEAGEGDAGWIS